MENRCPNLEKLDADVEMPLLMLFLSVMMINDCDKNIQKIISEEFECSSKLSLKYLVMVQLLQ